jgi:hypothetical protein
LRAAVDRRPDSAIALALREIAPAAASASAPSRADDNEAHESQNLMRILNYLAAHQLFVAPYTEDTHGAMAPAENFIASVDALRLRAMVAPRRPSANPPNIGDDPDFMRLLIICADDIRSRDKWAPVVSYITEWYVRAVEIQRQAEMEQGAAQEKCISIGGVEALVTSCIGDQPLTQGDRAVVLAALEWLYDRAAPAFGTLPFAGHAISLLRDGSQAPAAGRQP